MAEYIVEKKQTSGGWTWAEPKGKLIRCKDCKKYFPKTEERDSYCPFVGRIGLEPEGYCAWAERKEE